MDDKKNLLNISLSLISPATENKKTEFVKLWVKNDSGDHVEKIVKAPRIKFTFSKHQIYGLELFWEGMGGLEHLTEGFIRELRYHMDTTPELTIEGNTTLTKECKKYKNVANKCELLLKELNKISNTDRLNILSMRMESIECGGKVLPTCDPLDYVDLMKNLATEHIDDLKEPRKYKFHWDALRAFIQRFPPCKKLSKNKLTHLFFILYQPDSDIDENFRGKAERTIRKFK